MKPLRSTYSLDPIDVIPFKIVSKAIYSDDPNVLVQYSAHYESIKEQFEELVKKRHDNTLSTLYQIEALKIKYNTIVDTCNALNQARKLGIEAPVLESMLKNYGYYPNDLEKTLRYSQDILNRVESLTENLPKPTENKTTIDESVMSMCSITGLHFDPNVITTPQFAALNRQTQEKIKLLNKKK